MLFLHNIPTSQKVTLRKLLDSDNAEQMNHPLIKYTNPIIRFNCENEKLENQILDTYFIPVNPYIDEDMGVEDSRIILLFNHWAPRHFYQIYQRIQKLENRIKHFNAIHNFSNLLTYPTLTIGPQVMEYLLQGDNKAARIPQFQINDFHYTCAIINDNSAMIRWMDSVSPMTSHGLGKYVNLILLHERYSMFKWIAKKYPDHISENKNIYRNYAVRAKMNVSELKELFE